MMTYRMARKMVASVVSAVAGVALATGCSARSQLEVGSGSGCRAAVSGPKPMAGNCSTRDGQSRVSAPTAPRVKWTTNLPGSGPALYPSLTQLSFGLVTDDSGHAYLVTPGAGVVDAAVRRVDVASGAIDWAVPYPPFPFLDTPVILSAGTIDLMASGSVLSFNPSSGASTGTNFGLSFDEYMPDLGVGVDGSLYVIHGLSLAEGPVALSRVMPGGMVLWTSVPLGTLGPFVGGQNTSSVALAPGDLAVVFRGGQTLDGWRTVVAAFDPGTGVARWTTPIPLDCGSGPVVRPDGAIVVLCDTDSGPDLIVLDPVSGAASTQPLPGPALQIFGVTQSGAVIAGDGSGNFTAIDASGTTLWSIQNDATDASIAQDGTIITFGSEVSAIDGATGKTRWTLGSVVPGSHVVGGALTSKGGIVGLTDEGTLFGASD
jgi:hypothetical protein